VKQHLLSFLLACGALALFWALLFPKPASRETQAARPLSFETAPAGYAGLARWLAAEGVRVASLRHRFDDLPAAELALPRAGNLLVMTLPEAVAVRGSEIEAVEAWLREGNTLLLVAGMDDTPAWDRGSVTDLPARLQRLARLEFELVPEEGAAASLLGALQPASPELLPVARHPLNEGVTALVTRGELPASQWRVNVRDSAPVLVLARRADTGRPAVWLRPVGSGAVVVSAWSSPFANGQLDERDNARWVSQLMAWALGPRGVVIFDDMHQGAGVYYDPERFFADPRLHRSLAWMVALWFAWVLGWRALQPAVATRPPLDDTAMLRVTGGFLAHVLRPDDAARSLFDHFFNRLRRRLSLPESGEPLWEWLAAQARVDPPLLARVRRLHARAAAGRRVDLMDLQNTLIEITGRLS
jgi:hypothetical protein